MMEELLPLEERCARVSEVSMKMIAAPVVSLFMKVLPPVAPNTVWLPPAPKEAPISAPLPDCSSTTPIMNRLTTMCSTVNAIVIQCPLAGKLRTR